MPRARRATTSASHRRPVRRRHRLAGQPAARHADRQLSRGLAGRPSRRGIPDVFGRRGDAHRAAGRRRRAARTHIWLARIGVYLGLFVGVGGVFFAAWIGCGPDGGTTILRALGVGLVSAVASLGLQGLDLQNLPLSALATLAPWKAAFATSFGPSLLIAIAAMAIAGSAWRSPTHTIAWVLSTLPWQARDFRWPLAAMPRRRRRNGCRGRRCSSTASASPIGSARWRRWPQWRAGGRPICCGRCAVLGRQRCRSWPGGADRHDAGDRSTRKLRALVDTNYGIILLVKLALVIVLLGFAALNRFLVTPALAADPERHTAIAGVGPGRMRPGDRNFGCRRRLALHAAAACVAPQSAGAAFDPYSYRCRDVPGADLAGQGRVGQFCAAIDERRRQPLRGQGGDADVEPARSGHRSAGAQGRRSAATATGTSAT